MLKVTKGRVWHNGQAYSSGDLIEDATNDEEKRLVDMEVAEIIEAAKPVKSKDTKEPKEGGKDA